MSGHLVATIDDIETWPESVRVRRNGSCDVREYFPERTCTVVSTIRHDYEYGYAGTEYEHKLSCGHKTWWGDDYPPDWCPWCGAKVVDE